jgi:hypothetical protein
MIWNCLACFGLLVIGLLLFCLLIDIARSVMVAFGVTAWYWLEAGKPFRPFILTRCLCFQFFEDWFRTGTLLEVKGQNYIYRPYFNYEKIIKPK